MASGSESAKEEHYHNLTSKQREQILGKIYFKIIDTNSFCCQKNNFGKSPVLQQILAPK